MSLLRVVCTHSKASKPLQKLSPKTFIASFYGALFTITALKWLCYVVVVLVAVMFLFGLACRAWHIHTCILIYVHAYVCVYIFVITYTWYWLISTIKKLLNVTYVCETKYVNLFNIKNEINTYSTYIFPFCQVAEHRLKIRNC